MEKKYTLLPDQTITVEKFKRIGEKSFIEKPGDESALSRQDPYH